MCPRGEETGCLRADGRDEAVSPVIGMVLVLAISILGIASILYWGLPAIEEMKATVEYRSVTGQFNELDATIKELVAGTTERTAKRWQPAMSRGAVAVHPNTDGWLMAIEPYNGTAAYNFVWDEDIANGDAHFTIHNDGTALEWWRVEAFLVTGTTTTTALDVNLRGAGSGQMATVSPMPPVSGTWANGQSKEFTLWVDNAATQQAITGGTFKLRIYSGTTLVAEAFYVNSGRVEYSLDGPAATRSLIENNGAVIAGTETGTAIINTPSLPPPTFAGGIYRSFGRLVTLNGDAGFAGDARFDLLISLYSTATLASYDCASAAPAYGTDCVERSKVFVYGDQQDAWYDYLTSTGRGYRYTERTHAGVPHLVQTETMAYTLLSSTILLVD